MGLFQLSVNYLRTRTALHIPAVKLVSPSGINFLVAKSVGKV